MKEERRPAAHTAARSMRDLVALSTLSGVWIDQHSPAIAQGLASAIVRLGGTSFVFVRIASDDPGGQPHEYAIVGERQAAPDELERIGRAFGPWLDDPRLGGPTPAPDPLDTGLRELIVVPIGVFGMYGVVAAASPRFRQPPDLVRVLIGVAANQAASALGSAQINRERLRLVEFERARAAEIKVVSEALAKANAVKDELLGLVSHELKTPLTTILGMTDVIRRRPSQDAVVADALDDIADEADRLQRVIENMLVLARMESESDADAEPMLLQRTLPGQVEQFRRRLAGRTVHVDVPENLPPVLAQPNWLEHIVQNLLTNAAKYGMPGTPIEVTASADAAEATITVRDRGDEIDPSDLARLFEPFFRSARVRHVSGAGLGLAVVKRLVEAQNGRIWARAREGGWLEVAFTMELLGEREEAAVPAGPRHVELALPNLSLTEEPSTG